MIKDNELLFQKITEAEGLLQDIKHNLLDNPKEWLLFNRNYIARAKALVTECESLLNHKPNVKNNNDDDLEDCIDRICDECKSKGLQCTRFE